MKRTFAEHNMECVAEDIPSPAHCTQLHVPKIAWRWMRMRLHNPHIHTQTHTHAARKHMLLLLYVGLPYAVLNVLHSFSLNTQKPIWFVWNEQFMLDSMADFNINSIQWKEHRTKFHSLFVEWRNKTKINYSLERFCVRYFRVCEIEKYSLNIFQLNSLSRVSQHRAHRRK